MTDKPYKLAVKAVVEDSEGRYLLIRRSLDSKHFGGTWDLPGGKVDEGEDFATALLRETLEETGLTVSLEDVAGATRYEMPAVRLAVLFMTAKVTSGKIQLSDEHNAYEWVSKQNLAEKDLSDQLRDFLIHYVKLNNH